MRVREWDPAAAPADDIETYRQVYNAALATDLPTEPPWRSDKLREYLAITMPGEHRVCWTAYDSAGTALGVANVLLLGDIGVLEVFVHPDGRRHGVGRALLSAIANQSRTAGRSSLGVEVIDGTPAVDFYEANGFRLAYTELRAILDISAVDWNQVTATAGRVGAGYRIEYYPGGPPEALLVSYAEAKATVRHTPSNELDLHPTSYDAERLAASLRTLRDRGMYPYVVVAIHEPTGQVAGLTELVVPAQRPQRADQYDTVVVPTHRGYGLGLVMKSRMLLELRTAEPELVDVQTWHELDNEPMQRVNTELGFHPDRQWREYEAEVDFLARRLARRAASDLAAGS